jgi:hypothetical protein
VPKDQERDGVGAERPIPASLAADQETLLRILVRHKVRLVVLGGVGAQLRGWRSATTDLDITLERSDENTDRFNRALAEMGVLGEPQYGQFGTSFETHHGRLEVVRKADGIGGYEDWVQRASEENFGGGLVVVVAAGEDILTSKQAAGRAKDAAVLEQMREDLGSSG